MKSRNYRFLLIVQLFLFSSFSLFGQKLEAVHESPKENPTFSKIMAYWESGNQVELAELCNEQYTSNSINESTLKWAYNLLSEMDQKAVFFSMHQEEIVPLLILQNTKGIRQDIRIVNPTSLKSESGKHQLIELSSIDFSKLKTHEIIQESGKVIGTTYAGFKLLQELKKNTEISNNLYLNGLSYLYSINPCDNISLIRRNYEKKYLLDHLTIDLQGQKNDHSDYNQFYLPSLLKLYNHYLSSEEQIKANKIATYIAKIGSRNGQEQAILSILKSNTLAYENLSILTANIDVRQIEKSMMLVRNNLYFSDHEVTNEEYSSFLKNLLKSNGKELYNEVVYDSTMWTGKFPQAHNEPMKRMYHHHPAYSEYPVVNVKYEAAQIYCKWLTDQYNTNKKRKFQKVKFRLPTEKEWEFAASNGKPGQEFGLLNDTIVNEKGCYLANLQPKKGRFYDDGGFHTVKVKSYHSNEFNIFNMVGNASEMTQEKGIAKGGNWYSLPENSTISTRFNYTKEDPGVGFRVVMEIIEK